MAGQGEFVPISKSIEETEVQPVIIGMIFSFTLFGIGLLQFWDLYSELRNKRENHSKDLIILTILLIADVADSLGKAIFFVVWLRTIITGGLLAATSFPPEIILPCVTDGLVALCVHAVYARRLWRIVPNKQPWTKVMIGFIMCLSVAQLTGSIGAGVVAISPIDTWIPTMYPWASLWFAGAGIVDITLCCMLVYYLRRHRRDIDGRKNTVVTRFIILTFETALIPALCQIAELILYFSMQQNHIHFSIAINLPKIYINGVLILLRTALKTGSAGSTSYGSSNQQISNVSAPVHLGRKPSTQGVLVSSNVQTMHETMPYEKPVELEVRGHGGHEKEYRADEESL